MMTGRDYVTARMVNGLHHVSLILADLRYCNFDDELMTDISNMVATCNKHRRRLDKQIEITEGQESHEIHK